MKIISPFHGTTNISVLDFWSRLPWISKPGWMAPLACMLRRLHVLHSSVCPESFVAHNQKVTFAKPEMPATRGIAGGCSRLLWNLHWRVTFWGGWGNQPAALENALFNNDAAGKVDNSVWGALVKYGQLTSPRLVRKSPSVLCLAYSLLNLYNFSGGVAQFCFRCLEGFKLNRNQVEKRSGRSQWRYTSHESWQDCLRNKLLICK